MHYCPKCGAGIFNSNLPKCPMCDADLAKELAVPSYFEKPVRSTIWAKILCVILCLDAIWVIITGIMILNRETKYYIVKYALHGTYIESMEIFLRFGGVLSGIVSIVAIFGILTYKKIGPVFTYATHFLYASTYLMYIVNMSYEPIYSLIGGIATEIYAHMAIHTVLLIVNIFYFRRRKNVYDGVI